LDMADGYGKLKKWDYSVWAALLVTRMEGAEQ
jgi:hypothetical protein